MTFDDMWKSLEERDTTGKYKQAREMAELNMEQLEFAYNSGYADAKSKYERPQGEWIQREEIFDDEEIPRLVWGCKDCGFSLKSIHDKRNYCPNCGADMRKEHKNEN